MAAESMWVSCLCAFQALLRLLGPSGMRLVILSHASLLNLHRSRIHGLHAWEVVYGVPNAIAVAVQKFSARAVFSARVCLS